MRSWILNVKLLPCMVTSICALGLRSAPLPNCQSFKISVQENNDSNAPKRPRRNVKAPERLSPGDSVPTAENGQIPRKRGRQKKVVGQSLLSNPERDTRGLHPLLRAAPLFTSSEPVHVTIGPLATGSLTRQDIYDKLSLDVEDQKPLDMSQSTISANESLRSPGEAQNYAVDTSASNCESVIHVPGYRRLDEDELWKDRYSLRGRRRAKMEPRSRRSSVASNGSASGNKPRILSRSNSSQDVRASSHERESVSAEFIDDSDQFEETDSLAYERRHLRSYNEERRQKRYDKQVEEMRRHAQRLQEREERFWHSRRKGAQGSGKGKNGGKGRKRVAVSDNDGDVDSVGAASSMDELRDVDDSEDRISMLHNVAEEYGVSFDLLKPSESGFCRPSWLQLEEISVDEQLPVLAFGRPVPMVEGVDVFDLPGTITKS